MTRKILRRGDKAYIYYYCRTGKKNGCTNPVMIREDELEQCVLAGVQAHVQSVVTLSELLDSINEEQINRDAIASCKAQIAENEAKLEKANSIKATLYESFIDGVISKAEYKDHKERYNAQAESARKAIALLRESMENTVRNTGERAVVALLESIEIHGKTDIRINFRYKLEFDTAMKMVRPEDAPQSAVSQTFAFVPALLVKEAV